MIVTAAATFNGFPNDALAFYGELEAENTKTFWLANKHRYTDGVKAPMEALCASLPKSLQPFHIFRPFRDARFAKDKTPYKTQCGAVAEREGGASFYVALSKDGLLAGGGYYQMAKDQLERYRERLDDDKTSAALVKAVDAVRKAGFDVASFDSLKTAPKGYPKDHPRIELLRMKGIHAGRALPAGNWLSTAAARDRVIEVFKAVEPLCAWLDKNVGPSTEPPDDRWTR
jgi:uncharacterized protein (TIGR02453 family)